MAHIIFSRALILYISDNLVSYHIVIDTLYCHYQICWHWVLCYFPGDPVIRCLPTRSWFCPCVWIHAIRAVGDVTRCWESSHSSPNKDLHDHAAERCCLSSWTLHYAQGETLLSSVASSSWAKSLKDPRKYEFFSGKITKCKFILSTNLFCHITHRLGFLMRVIVTQITLFFPHI